MSARRRVPPTAVAAFALSMLVTACSGGEQSAPRESTAVPGSRFCTLAADVIEAQDRIDDTATDPAEFEAAYTAMVTAMAATYDEAPYDIVDSMRQVLEFQRDVGDLMAEHDWVLEDAWSSSSGGELFGDDEIVREQERVAAYLEDGCGIAGEVGVPDTMATDTTVPTNPLEDASGEFAEGELGITQFLRLFEIGSGMPLSDEQRSCLIDDLSGKVSPEQLGEMVFGVADEAAEVVVGLAFVECGVTIS